MSAEENKAIVKKWEDALFTCDAKTIKSTAKEVFAPEFFMNHGTRTAEGQGNHWAEVMSDRDPEKVNQNVKLVHRIGEGEYILSFFEMVFQYKDKTWDFPVSRFVKYQIQNGKIVDYRAANNRSGLQKSIDNAEIT